MKTKQLKWLLGLLAIVTMIAAGVMIGMTPESLQAKKSSEIEKTTKKASASLEEETLPEVAGQPRVVYPVSPGMPIVPRDKINVVDLVPDPDFVKWTDYGVPEGWNTGFFNSVYNNPDHTGNLWFYTPGGVGKQFYDKDNYDQVIEVTRNLSPRWDYGRWQRIKGGGIKASIGAAGAEKLVSPYSDNFNQTMDITKGGGNVLYLDADIQKGHIDPKLTNDFFKDGNPNPENARAQIGLYPFRGGQLVNTRLSSPYLDSQTQRKKSTLYRII